MLFLLFLPPLAVLSLPRFGRLAPIYRLHSRYEDGKTEMDNALNLEAVLLWNRWTVLPSAGFRWEDVKEFGDNANFHIRVEREL